DGPFGGVDQVVVTTVDTDANPPQVIGVERHLCSVGIINPVPDPTFTPIPPLTWPTGIGNGLTSNTLDLVELYAPLPDPKTSTEVRWAHTASVVGNPSLGDFMPASPIAWAST